MFAASTYEEIEALERTIENMEIVVFLFAKSTESDILKEFEYLHYNAAGYCSIYAIGYTDNFDKAKDYKYKKVDVALDNDWFFSTEAFVDFKMKLESRIKWKYSGEPELLILQNNPGGRSSLNFQNYVAINVNKGIREGYIDSFQSFMEALVYCSRSNELAKDVICEIGNRRISVKDILASSIEACKKIPAPVKNIIKDRLFYRSARYYT